MPHILCERERLQAPARAQGRERSGVSKNRGTRVEFGAGQAQLSQLAPHRNASNSSPSVLHAYQIRT